MSICFGTQRCQSFRMSDVQTSLCSVRRPTGYASSSVNEANASRRWPRAAFSVRDADAQFDRVSRTNVKVVEISLKCGSALDVRLQAEGEI